MSGVWNRTDVRCRKCGRACWHSTSRKELLCGMCKRKGLSRPCVNASGVLALDHLDSMLFPPERYIGATRRFSVDERLARVERWEAER